MDNDDIEVDYRPIRKIVILDLEELDKEELFKRVSAIRVVEEPIFLNWANGIVFIAIPASTDITEVNENITNGTAYYSNITYSFMPKYQSLVEVGFDKIPILDQSKSPVFKSVAKWIIKRKIK